MKAGDDDVEKDLQRLKELLDRLGCAGYLELHAEVKGGLHVVALTPKGEAMRRTLLEIEAAAGPLGSRDWWLLANFAKVSTHRGDEGGPIHPDSR